MAIHAAVKQNEAPGPLPGAMHAWISLIILLLLTVLSHFDRNIMSLMVDLIKEDLQISDVQFSLLHGLAFSLFYAVSTIPMGFVADRYSRHWIIFFGVVCWSFATMACGLAGSFVGLFAARFLVGVGESTLGPASYSLAGDMFPRRRLAMALGILGMGSAIGVSVATVAGGFTIHWAVENGGFGWLKPWQLVFVIAGLPGLILAPLVFMVAGQRKAPPKIESVVKEPVPDRDGYGRWLRANAAYMITLCVGTSFHAMAAFALAWLAAYFKRHFGLEVTQIGIMIGLASGLPAVIGFIAGGWLVDRLHSAGVKDAHYRYFVFNCLVLTIVGTLAFSLVESLPLLLLLLVLINLLIPFSGPAMAHLQMVTPPQYRAKNTAIILVVQSALGLAVGPSGAAMISQYVFGGPQYIGYGMAGMFAIAGGIGTLAFIAGIGPARRALERATATSAS